ncbi:DMT family transporter [Fictibacillus terranigra]|uniref:DMT family transporter n=1 Tax=Fictibacillus terranigra TaxID=3058424 RepID=A0ABT8EBY9_9BACL|nr:DMT family transporter [Fictibacillus sp. CENA-BCM004]MDN4075436.1 DMT family transporter [Fictibacillus sp. CENA-BCM004]
MGELLAIFALFLFSANIIITKMAATRLNLNFGFLISVGVNVLFGAFLFLIYVLFFEGGNLDWNTKGFFLFMSAGLFSTYLGRWFFFDTIDKLGPTRASAFQVSNPLFTTIIAWLFMGEKLHWMDLSAVILILFGLVLVSFVAKNHVKEIAATGGQLEIKSVKGFSFKWLLQSGILLAFLSSLAYAVGNVVRGAAIQSWNQPIFGGILGALLGLLLHVVTNKNSRGFWTQLRISDRGGVLLYTISGVITISAQILVIASMRYIPISIANLITLSTPVIVAPLSYFLFKNQEVLTYRTIVGIMLVMGGICFIVL